MSILVRNGTLVTMDRPGAFRGDLLIERNRIPGLGDLRGTPETEHVIDATDCLVIPGLIQTHVHLAQTLFRGMAEDLSLLDWLSRRIWPLEAAMDREAMRASAELGMAEMLLGGTTGILDFGSPVHQDIILDSMAAMGVRGRSGMIMMDLDAGAPDGLIRDTRECLAESERFIRHLRGVDLLGYMVTPRFPLSCSEELLAGSRELASRYGVGIQTHASENRDEVEAVRKRSGLSDLELLDRCGVLGPDLVLAHCIWLDDGGLMRLRDSGTSVAHCPGSNMKLGSGIARIADMVAAGINVTLGSDGAACGNGLNMFNEMRGAALLQKVACLDPEAIPAGNALAMATVNGAAAMGLTGELGILKVGALADLAVVSRRRPGGRPVTGYGDPHSDLVHALGASDVTHTVVDGRIMVESGELVATDAGAVMNRADDAARRVIQRSGIFE